MRKILLPRKLRDFLIPIVLAFSFLLILGGLYFYIYSRSLISVRPTAAEPGGEVSGTTTALPIYRPSVVVSRSEFRGSLEVTLETKDSADEVLRFYNSVLAAQGFVQVKRSATPGSTFATYSHSDGRVLELALETEGTSRRTVITLYLTYPPTPTK